MRIAIHGNDYKTPNLMSFRGENGEERMKVKNKERSCNKTI
jgi:hypothetical protein